MEHSSWTKLASNMMDVSSLKAFFWCLLVQGNAGWWHLESRFTGYVKDTFQRHLSLSGPKLTELYRVRKSAHYLLILTVPW